MLIIEGGNSNWMKTYIKIDLELLQQFCYCCEEKNWNFDCLLGANLMIYFWATILICGILPKIFTPVKEEVLLEKVGF